MSTELASLRDQLEALTVQREIAEAKVTLHEMTMLAEQGRIVMEAWGDRIDPTEYLYDDPTFGRYTAPISRRDDRSDGKYRPVFETEQDLAFIRGACHVISTGFGSAINILENLTNYTISDGFTHEVVAAGKHAPEGLVQVAQEVLDTFFDDNDWASDLEREIHWRSREDGEAPLVLQPCGWRTRARLIEPDEITQPAAPGQLEEWLWEAGRQVGSPVAGEFVASWSFGVHTRANDPARPLGYHCVFDGAGSDWDYFPANDVPLAKRLGTGVMELIKRNVPRNVKRGVTDFYPVMRRLERAEKLSTNVELTSAIQAAIAFIREHAPTATPDQVSGLRALGATETVQRGSRTVRRQKLDPGTIVDTNGTKYLYGPMGQNNAPNFIDVIQAALRASGSRWVMPEYMISGDASNANFASTMVAGAPFVKAREADQRFYASRFHRIDWIVLRIAYEGGRFARFGLPWEAIEAALDVRVTPPDITIADDLKQAQVKEIERRNNVLSAKTWRAETGRDTEAEEEALAEERKTGISPPASGLPVEGTRPTELPAKPAPAKPEPSSDSAPEIPNASAQGLNGAQITAAKDVIMSVSTRSIAPEPAIELLVAVGIAQDTAERMVRASQKIAPEQAKAVAESLIDTKEVARAARRKLWRYP